MKDTPKKEKPATDTSKGKVEGEVKNQGSVNPQSSVIAEAEAADSSSEMADEGDADSLGII